MKNLAAYCLLVLAGKENPSKCPSRDGALGSSLSDFEYLLITPYSC